VLLLTVVAGGRPAMAVQSLETGERRVLAHEAGFTRAVGRSLIWMENGRLMSAPFDADRLALAGAPVAISVEGLDDGETPSVLDVSASGAMLFLRSNAASRRAGADIATVMASRAGNPALTSQGLVWIDRKGAKTPVDAHESLLDDPRLSPDGARVAAQAPSSGGDQDDVWAIDLRRGGVSRLSFGDGEDETAVWSPDGAWIAWASSRAGEGRSLYRRRSDGSVEEKLWSSDGRHFHADGWTLDGKGILISVDNPKTGWDVVLVTLAPTASTKPLLTGPFNETMPRLSPDGRWIVYSSDESGQQEIYAEAFPGLGHRVQVSIDGGSEPVWNPSGGEIVFRAARSRHFMSVSAEGKETLVLSAPRELVSDVGIERGGEDHTEFDVASDGRLLAVAESPPDYRVDMHVILGWAQAAKLLP
jgi:eukaryotic-like serine/threonine-protein kinase